jgi:hypothetical protein
MPSISMPSVAIHYALIVPRCGINATTVYFELDRTRNQNHHTTISMLLPLGKVCSQTRAETRLMFFELNRPVISLVDQAPEAFDTFLNVLSAEQRTAIKRLHVETCVSHSSCAQNLKVESLTIARLEGLEQITIKAVWNHLGDTKEEVFGHIREYIDKQTRGQVKIVFESKFTTSCE